MQGKHSVFTPTGVKTGARNKPYINLRYTLQGYAVGRALRHRRIEIAKGALKLIQVYQRAHRLSKTERISLIFQLEPKL